MIDKAIDRALGYLRSKAPSVETSRQSLAALIKTIDQIGGKN